MLGEIGLYVQSLKSMILLRVSAFIGGYMIILPVIQTQPSFATYAVTLAQAKEFPQRFPEVGTPARSRGLPDAAWE